jgi:hypothetical protein
MGHKSSKTGRENMARVAKDADEKFVEVGYEAKVVFTSKSPAKVCPDVLATWQQSQGLWGDHPVFQGMSIREVIEWLRGEDCDV